MSFIDLSKEVINWNTNNVCTEHGYENLINNDYF